MFNKHGFSKYKVSLFDLKFQTLKANPTNPPKKLIESLKKILLPKIIDPKVQEENYKFKPCYKLDKVSESILEYEMQNVSKTFKFGVLNLSGEQNDV